MALQKTIQTNFGADGNYIKVERFHGDKLLINFNVALYLNQSARDAGKKPMHIWGMEWNMPSSTGNDLLVDLYNHLKTLPEFSGALDV